MRRGWVAAYQLLQSTAAKVIVKASMLSDNRRLHDPVLDEVLYKAWVKYYDGRRYDDGLKYDDLCDINRPSMAVFCLMKAMSFDGWYGGDDGDEDGGYGLWSNILDEQFKYDALAGGNGGIMPFRGQLAAYIGDIGKFIVGKPDVMLYDMKSGDVELVEVKHVPVLSGYDYRLFLRKAVIQLSIYAWLLRDLYVNVNWITAYPVIFRTTWPRIRNTAYYMIYPVKILPTGHVKNLIIKAHHMLARGRGGRVSIDDCRLAKLIYGDYAACDGGLINICAPQCVLEVNRRINNVLFGARWRVDRSLCGRVGGGYPCLLILTILLTAVAILMMRTVISSLN
jgi:hypothetical protein